MSTSNGSGTSTTREVALPVVDDVRPDESASNVSLTHTTVTRASRQAAASAKQRIKYQQFMLEQSLSELEHEEERAELDARIAEEQAELDARIASERARTARDRLERRIRKKKIESSMLELSIAADEADDRITRSGFQGATSHVSFTHQPAQSETSGSYHDASEVDQAVAATVDSHTSHGKETVRDNRSVRQQDTSVTATHPITTTTVFNPPRSLTAAADSSSIFHPITTTTAAN